ncbi:hypothetical protein QBC34DRAFT_437532 [Podospora aff. communis PSN243]|uniref:Reticulon-like protein n=1 Tax=Podospora aff. communis PSN243 TaxID=3040156 RepID=A0AAV9GQS4_9PEZI|nr:hypothetical protein QBC34DRAFT_437532 [Podospora aff. communis PSN243]
MALAPAKAKDVEMTVQQHQVTVTEVSVKQHQFTVVDVVSTTTTAASLLDAVLEKNDVAFVFHYLLSASGGDKWQWLWRWYDRTQLFSFGCLMLFFGGLFVSTRYQLEKLTMALFGGFVVSLSILAIAALCTSAWFYISKPFFIALGLTNQPWLKGDPARRRMRFGFEFFRLLSVYCWQKGWKDHAWLILVCMLLFLWAARATVLLMRVTMGAWALIMLFLNALPENVDNGAQTTAQPQQSRKVEEVE